MEVYQRASKRLTKNCKQPVIIHVASLFTKYPFQIKQPVIGMFAEHFSPLSQSTSSTTQYSWASKAEFFLLYDIAGRLNVLANVVRKPMRQIFSEFGGVMPSGDYYGTGDVKYHLGTSYDRPTISGKRVHLSLLANPSHLEVSRTVPRVYESIFSHCKAAR